MNANVRIVTICMAMGFYPYSDLSGFTNCSLAWVRYIEYTLLVLLHEAHYIENTH